MSRWDVVVVGAGAVGCAALRAASEAGARVLGLDRFEPGHDRGSSHGRSRIFRHAYFEHPDYVPLLRHSTARFESLEQESGSSLLLRCGMLVFGASGAQSVLGSLASARRWGLEVDALDARELRSRFPWLEFADDSIGAFEANAGIVRPEATMHASLTVARSRGAELRTGSRVLSLDEARDGVAVHTDRGTERASAVIVAAGPWAANLLPELAPLLTVTRQVQAWFAPTRGTDVVGMPCWLFDRGPGRRALYGLAPDPGQPPGLPKLGLHGSDEVVDPDCGARPVDADDLAALREAGRDCALRLAGELAGAATCLYTMSPDGDFLVGTRTGSRRVHFAAGLSGHGFKLAPSLGDALAGLALEGRTSLPVRFLSPSRFDA